MDNLTIKFFSNRVAMYETALIGLEKRALPVNRTKVCAKKLHGIISKLSLNPILNSCALTTQRGQLETICNRLQTLF